MDTTENCHKRRCRAMIDAGIENPDSPEGILFCAGSRDDKIKSQCPYKYCVVFEHKLDPRARSAEERMKFTRDLFSHGVSREDIALIIGKHLRTVERYLRL